jgi:hypothetical protein
MPYNPRSENAVKKVLLMTTGWILVVVGPVVGVIPGPGGIPIVAAGLVLILSQSYTAKRMFLRLERRHPRVFTPIRRFMSRHKHPMHPAGKPADV